MVRLFTLILITTAVCMEAAPNGRFLLLGDWGRDPEDTVRHAAQRDVAMAMGKATATQRPAAIICLGDNFYPDGAATIDSPLFESAFEKVYTAPSLQVPFWVILGNHDYHKSAQGQLDYATQRRGTGRWTMDARYWTRTAEVAPGTKAKFFFLDTSPFITSYQKVRSDGKFAEVRTQDTAKQLTWLEKELSEPGITWRIVIGHHPIWSGGNHGDTAEIKQRVLPVLQKYKVQLYACGHDHHAEVFVRDRLTAVIAGNGSELRSTKPTEGSVYIGRHTGFTDLTLGRDKGEIRVLDAAGDVKFTQSLSL